VPSNAAWLGGPSSYIGLPIAPNVWFVAAGTKSFADRLVARPQRELILTQNRATVGHAQNFVGAKTPKAAKFIKANFGGLPRFSVTQSMAKNQPEMGNPPIFAGQSVEFAASLAAHYLCLPLPEADSRHRVCDRQYVLIQEGGYALVARPKGGCRACRRD
jgi:hypothetical protein